METVTHSDSVVGTGSWSGFFGGFSFLRAQPASDAPLTDPLEIEKSYSYWRVRTMVGMFVGYAIFYFCRKNLSAATPAMIAELGYSKTEIGSIWSCLYLTYGVSKMVNGVVGDRANPRYFMAIGLFLSALTNILFGMSSSLAVFGFFWALNGWFQGMGWPPCARLLTHWYSQNERGTYWGIWNTAHQIGGGLILVLGGYLTEKWGWRSSFLIPSVIAILTSLFLVERLRDTPESLEGFRRQVLSESADRKISQRSRSFGFIQIKSVVSNGDQKSENLVSVSGQFFRLSGSIWSNGLGSDFLSGRQAFEHRWGHSQDSGL